LATKLLNMATEFMKQNEIDFGSLHTGNAVPLYESIGFESVTRSFISYPFQEFKERFVVLKKKKHIWTKTKTNCYRNEFGKEWTFEQCDIKSNLSILKQLHKGIFSMKKSKKKKKKKLKKNSKKNQHNKKQISIQILMDLL